MAEAEPKRTDYQGGTDAPWYEGWEITEERRAAFRATAVRSREAKLRALAGDGVEHAHPVNRPSLDPGELMPQIENHSLASLSLFSGGGGLDLGFDRAGMTHIASYDTLQPAGETLRQNRPEWSVYAGEDGDVRATAWSRYRGTVDVLHGGPPCQPFSAAGRQKGDKDGRNLLPEFVRCVRSVRPAAFVAENVPALAGPKFAPYLRKTLYRPLESTYHVATFKLSAHEFGVPQVRHRVFFVGFRRKRDFLRFAPPEATHHEPGAESPGLKATMGTRRALGLDDLGVDALAPTLRSTLTGPRHTTSILSSASAQRTWAKLHIGPTASRRPAKQPAPSPLRMVTSGFQCQTAPCFRAFLRRGRLTAPCTWRSGRSAIPSPRQSPTASPAR